MGTFFNVFVGNMLSSHFLVICLFNSDLALGVFMFTPGGSLEKAFGKASAMSGVSDCRVLLQSFGTSRFQCVCFVKILEP